MDIECALTGKHFNGVEAARDCANNHDHCNSCPARKQGDNTPIHFRTANDDALTQPEIDKLMEGINEHLKAEHTIPPPLPIEITKGRLPSTSKPTKENWLRAADKWLGKRLK
jgi:hypothetical protein